MKAVKHEPRSVCSDTEKVDETFEKVQPDKHFCTVDIYIELVTDYETLSLYLHKVGNKKKLVVWFPHKLSAKTG